MTNAKESGSPRGNSKDIFGAPAENFSRGILSIEIPKLGPKTEGKVRDIWNHYNGRRVMVTTDRQSAFDRMICTVPGKGQVLNLLSAFWFEKTKDIIQNHVIDIPHPNVLIANESSSALPVEVIVRDFMAKSSTTTSIYYNYFNLGRREIYGIKFPDGLKANEKFPMGPIVTPTTKAASGEHDVELTDQEAKNIVDSKLGNGTWQEAKQAALKIFQRGSKHCAEKGLILADTKFEFGLNDNTDLILIDELLTPDSSRFWLLATYLERFYKEENPDTYDKDILRRWLASQGFTGKEKVPVVDPNIIDQMAVAYKKPYEMITGEELPEHIFSYPSQFLQKQYMKDSIERYFKLNDPFDLHLDS